MPFFLMVICMLRVVVQQMSDTASYFCHTRMLFWLKTRCALSMDDLVFSCDSPRLRNNDLSLEEVEELSQRESRLIF